MRFMSLVICFKLHRSVVVVWNNHFRLAVPYNWRNCRRKRMKKPLEERNNLIIILNGHHDFKSQHGSSLWVFSFNSCTSYVQILGKIRKAIFQIHVHSSHILSVLYTCMCLAFGCWRPSFRAKSQLPTFPNALQRSLPLHVITF